MLLPSKHHVPTDIQWPFKEKAKCDLVNYFKQTDKFTHMKSFTTFLSYLVITIEYYHSDSKLDTFVEPTLSKVLAFYLFIYIIFYIYFFMLEEIPSDKL